MIRLLRHYVDPSSIFNALVRTLLLLALYSNHCLLLSPESALNPGVVVKRRERHSQTSQPLPLQSCVDCGRSFGLVFQQVDRHLRINCTMC